MKKVITICTVLLLLGVVLALVNTRQLNKAFAQPPGLSEGVVVMLCTGDPDNFPVFTVTAFSNSSDAPAVSLGTNCAQAVADLLKAHFEIKNVQSANQLVGVIYTLVGSR